MEFVYDTRLGLSILFLDFKIYLLVNQVLSWKRFMMSRPNDDHKISKYLRSTKNSNRLNKVLFQGLINQEGRVNTNLTTFSTNL